MSITKSGRLLYCSETVFLGKIFLKLMVMGHFALSVQCHCIQPKNMAQHKTCIDFLFLVFFCFLICQFAIDGDPWLFHVELVSKESQHIILLYYLFIYFIESSKLVIYLFISRHQKYIIQCHSNIYYHISKGGKKKFTKQISSQRHKI